MFIRSAFNRSRRLFSSNALFYTSELEGGKVQVLNLNNPKKRNALSGQMLKEMNDSLDALLNNNDMMAVILRSTIEGMFCAGADLKERLMMNNEQTEATVNGLRETFHKLYNLPVPVIACMDGPCLGGGLELGLACDIRISTDSSKFGLPELGLAIIPG